MNRDQLVERLIKHEGLRLKPYRDSVGKLTIGIGRNLDDVGISAGEARVLCIDDIMNAEAMLDGGIPWWRDLDEVRKQVLAEMAFNMGWTTLSKFSKMLNAAHNRKWDDAANEMLASKWASQVGERADTLAKAMRTGAFDAVTTSNHAVTGAAAGRD